MNKFVTTKKTSESVSNIKNNERFVQQFHHNDHNHHQHSKSPDPQQQRQQQQMQQHKQPQQRQNCQRHSRTLDAIEKHSRDKKIISDSNHQRFSVVSKQRHDFRSAFKNISVIKIPTSQPNDVKSQTSSNNNFNSIAKKNKNNNVNNDGSSLKSIDVLSDADSGIASNGTISEVQTPDADYRTNLPQLFLPANLNNINASKIYNTGNSSYTDNHGMYEINKTNSILIVNEVKMEELNNSTSSSNSGSKVSTLTRNISKSIDETDVIRSRGHEYTVEEKPGAPCKKLNFQRMVDLNANSHEDNILSNDFINNDKNIHHNNNHNSINVINKNCNKNQTFNEVISKSLTSSLSVQETKSNRYEKNSHSSLSYLPYSVNVLSTAQERIMKMKDRQNNARAINASLTIFQNGSSFNDENKLFPVIENETISETSFVGNLQQTTLPRVKKSAFKTPETKSAFKSILGKNLTLSTPKPKKFPASHFVSYNYRGNNSNKDNNNLEKTSSALSLKNIMNNQPCERSSSNRRQSINEFFNSLTKFFRRKTKIDVTFDQEIGSNTLPLRKMHTNKTKDLNNNEPNLKNYNSDSNLTVMKNSNQSLNESFYSNINNGDSKPSLTSQFVNSLNNNYSGAQSLNQSLLDLNKWNNLLMKFSKTQQPNIILKTEGFQNERSKFKRSIRKFMIDAKEAILNYHSQSTFDSKIRLSCCSSYADVVSCCCTLLDYISVNRDRQNLAEMVCYVGKTFYVVVSSYLSDKHQSKNAKLSPLFFRKVDLLIERSKNLAVYVDALKYAVATRLL